MFKKIKVIFNKYKDMLNNLIDSLDIKFSSILNLINKELYNVIPNSEEKSIKTKSKFINNFLNKSK